MTKLPQAVSVVYSPENDEFILKIDEGYCVRVAQQAIVLAKSRPAEPLTAMKSIRRSSYQDALILEAEDGTKMVIEGQVLHANGYRLIVRRP